ncbi:thiol-disulfide oxidoreductase ResA [Effusibacillus pohliae]|uniref:thiol-disulfide oxidoreductase ResA n=1 Tax=Effusibacillus pohliae TaxID=232270 RepID=UPI000378D2CD|nr:thiol-disulfide oxidoreductase ResA [Effusibacillus pohliae]
MAVRSKLGRAVTVGVLILAAAGIIFALINFTKADKTGVGPGQSAPDFSLADLNGRTVSLHDLKGKVVLLNFWGSWCDPCREEMPALETAYKQYKDKGFTVVGVNIAESRVTAKGFTDRFGVTFPVLLDSDRDVTLNRYKVGPIPTSFLIDKQGRVQEKFERPLTADLIASKVEPLLAQP